MATGIIQSNIKFADITITSTEYGHAVVTGFLFDKIINIFSRESGVVILLRGYSSNHYAVVELYKTDGLATLTNHTVQARVAYVD